MKRPYREGDWFAIPHGDGSYSAGIVTQGMRKVVSAAIFGRRFDRVPALAALSGLDPRDALWQGMMSDRAIVHERWPVLGGSSSFARDAWPHIAASERILAPVALEWLVACGSLPPQREGVRDLRADVVAADLAAHDRSTQFQWRRPLPAASLEALEAIARNHDDAKVRLYGDGLAQLPLLAGWPVRVLTIGRGTLPDLPAFPHVRSLCIEREIDIGILVARFPNLRSLRIAAGAVTLDIAALSRLGALEVLDCSGCAIGSLTAVSSLPRLRALRLYRTRGWSSLAELHAASLRALCIEHQIALSDLHPLTELRSLCQLELRGLWQFNVEDLEWLFACGSLQRVSIDIGGRRKNVELYRRGRWAEAWPFPWGIQQS